MSGYDLAVFLVGSPSLTFQTAASSIARVTESFNIGESLAFYSGFAKKEAEEVAYFTKKLFNVDLELKPLPRSLGEAVNVFQQVFKGGKAIAVPTSGSLLGAVALSAVASRVEADLGHVLFPFGPWTGFFYPYIPRYLQPVQVLGNPPEPRKPSFDREEATKYLEEKVTFLPRLLKRVASLCVDLNLSLPLAWVNDQSIPQLVLELCKTVKGETLRKTLLLRTTVATVDLCELSCMKVARGAFSERRNCLSAYPLPDRKLFKEFVKEAFSSIAGVGKSCEPDEWMYLFTGFELIDLKPDEQYLIDTNLIYFGVHNVVRGVGPRVYVPYCLHVEILDKVAESKRVCEKLIAEALLMAYEVIEANASKVPSAHYKCDIAIPSIDPELVKGLTVVTADKRAYELWGKLALSKYAKLKLVDGSVFRSSSESEAHFALIQLAALLIELARRNSN
ncbi:MAG: hypothetical protein N3E41_06510 [Thermofilaceae archaeon]|nr:hypothetical protein [Thermofilaceae archaeon]